MDALIKSKLAAAVGAAIAKMVEAAKENSLNDTDMPSVSGTGGNRRALNEVDPLAEGQADVAYDGAFIGAGGNAYSRSAENLANMPRVQPTNGKIPGAGLVNETIIQINGMRTNKEKQMGELQATANATGQNVIGIHNATEGTRTDLVQSANDKLNRGKNPAYGTAAATIYHEINAGRQVHIIAHSQGAIITSRALDKVKSRLMNEDHLTKRQAEEKLQNVTVDTFGGAALRYTSGPHYHHYINTKDAIARFLGQGGTQFTTKPGGDNAEFIKFTSGSHLSQKEAHSYATYLAEYEKQPHTLPHRYHLLP